MTDYIIGKWKTWYKNLDVNHDGTISMADVEESRTKFANLHQLVGEKSSGVKHDMEEWWNKYIFIKDQAEVSEAQFIEKLGNKYNTDKAAFVTEMQGCFNMIFDVIDTNKDRSIDMQEFIYAFQAFGHENQNIVKEAFKLFSNEKGDPVPMSKIVDGWVTFVTSDDPNATDIIKKAFDSQ